MKIIFTNPSPLEPQASFSAFGEVRFARSKSECFSYDYTYTGQKYEEGFGLSYYVARWYDSTTAHFVQADTLIPQPGNAGDWDRYAYVLNNPMKYTDPTGHQVCTEDGYCIGDNSSFEGYLDFMSHKYGVQFTTKEGNEWDINVKWAFIEGIKALGEKLSESLGISDPALAFHNFFGSLSKDTITLQYSCPDCSYFAWANHPDEGTVSFAGFYNQYISNATFIIHELTHIWERSIGYVAQRDLPVKLVTRDYFKTNKGGIYYQHGQNNTRGEIFADLMVAWIFGKWKDELAPNNVGYEQNTWMDDNMPKFFQELARNGQ